MKKVFFSIVFFGTLSSLFAQAVTVANTAANIAFIGIDNPIQITAQGYAANELTVTASQGSIEPSPTQKGVFIWHVNAQGLAKIAVSAKGKQIYEAEYEIKRINMPIAELNNYKKQIRLITVDDLLKQTGVTAQINGANPYECTIASYELTLVPPSGKGDPVSVTNTGAPFSAIALNLLSRAETNATYYFDNVQAKCASSTDLIKINPIMYRVK